MKIFSYRYTCIIISFFMAGCLLGSFINTEQRYILLSSFALLSILSVLARIIAKGKLKAIYSKKCSTITSLSLAAIALSMFCCLAFYDFSFKESREFYEAEKSYTMEVTEVYLDKPYATEFKAKLICCEDEKLFPQHYVYVSLDYGADIYVGDIISCFATLKDSNDSPIDGYYFYQSNECHIICDEMTEIEIIDQSNSIIFRISEIRRKLSEYISANTESSSGLATSLLLGDRSDLSPSLKLDFKRIGISHILALSGLHISIISIGLEFVLRKLRIHKTARFVLELAFVLFYVVITGFSISVIRSAIMLASVAVTYFFWCDHDSMTSLFLSAFAICFISPASITNTSFMLSFLATFGVLAYLEFASFRDTRKKSLSKKTSILKRALKKLIDSFFISAFACVMTFGVSILHFNEFSPYAPIFNVIFCPLFTVYIYFSVITLPLLEVHPVARLCDIFADFISDLVHTVANIPHLLKSSNDTAMKIGIALAIILMLYALIADLKTKKKILSVITSSFAMFIVSLLISNIIYAADDKIIYQRESENEQIIIRTDGCITVCDITDGYSSTLYELSDGIYRSGSTEIDTYMITHYHEAYTKSIRKLSGIFKIYTLALPTPENQYEEKIYRELVDMAREEGIDHFRYDKNDDLDHSDGMIKLLFSDYPDQSTHKVIAASFDTENYSLLYLSDMLHTASAIPRDLLLEINDAECIFFGAHGTKYDKSEIPYDCYSDKLKAFAFHSNEVVFSAPRTGEHLRHATKFILPTYFEFKNN